jgi:peptidyl-prolyl cis-trans isomerase SurA
MRFVTIFIAALVLLAAPARAEIAIVALVNDEVVSTQDIEARMGLLALSGNPEITNANRSKITPSILRNLVDETLQRQEAQRLNIMVTEGELNAAIARLAEQNSMTAEDFIKKLDIGGGIYDSLLGQIRATIVWTKLVRQKFSASVIIPQNELNAMMDKMRSQTAAPEFLISAIFLPIDTPDAEAATTATANQLVTDILGGKPFADVARTFAKNPEAENGGDMGWVKAATLEDILATRLATMQPNQISRPLRTKDGLTILFLREIKNPQAADDAALRDRATDILRQKKLETAARKYLRDIRSLATIDIRN